MAKKKKELQQSFIESDENDTEMYQNNTSHGKSGEYWASYEDVFTFTTKQVGDSFLRALAERYVRWSSHPRSITINQFLVKEGIPKSTFHLWISRFEPLKMAHEHVRATIASRLSEGTVFMDSGMREHAAAFMLPHYDNDYKSQIEWRTKLKDTDSGQASDFIVQELPYEPSAMVPEKKSKPLDAKHENHELQLLNDSPEDI